MRKWITFLMTLLVGSSLSYINAADTTQVTFEAGYRRDNLQGSRKVPSSNPIYKTTTKIDDLDIFQVGIKARTLLGGNFYMRANANWGWVVDGDFKQTFTTFTSPGVLADSDISQDLALKKEARDVIDDRYVYDLSIGFGYPFYFCNCTLAISPVIGYAIDGQTIRTEHRGFNLEAVGGNLLPVAETGSFNHKLHSRWYGPFIGADFVYRPAGEAWNLYAELEYHYAHFKAKFNDVLSDRNYRSHRAHGWVFAVGADYELSDDWTLGLCVKFQDYHARRRHRHGHSSSELFGSDHHGRSKARNTNKWDSCAVSLALGKSF